MYVLGREMGNQFKKTCFLVACLSVFLPAGWDGRAAVDVHPVFPANNIWNAPVDALPLDPNSAAYVASIGPGENVHADFGSGTWNGGPIGIPFVSVPGSQPMAAIHYTNYGDESDPGPFPIPADAPVEGGSGSGGDRHVLVVDDDHGLLFELFRAFLQPDGSWNAESGARYDLKSNALRPAGWTSADAAGLPIFPGLVRYDEVATGEITHAIRFTAPRTRRSYVWPARHFASSSDDPGLPPMGQRFRLKAGVDISGYSAPMRVILRAMKKYGIILADNGAPWYISGAPDERWDNDMLHELDAILGSDFEAVDCSGLMIDPDSGQAGSPDAPIIHLSKTSFHFGAERDGTPTRTATAVITNTGTEVLIWTAAPSTDWISVSPLSGSGAGVLTIGIARTDMAPGAYAGTIAITSPNASNSPQTINVGLDILPAGTSQAPFGSFDSPVNESNVSSSIAVTGWALDDIEAAGVKIYRDPAGAEPLGSRIFIGDATFVEGARPDVELAYSVYPLNRRAGWGYMLLTNFLPDGGDGTYTLHAYATDKEGHEVLLGSKTVACDNAHAVKPFGAIDLPAQGAMISGSTYINGGWALTPQPNGIPTDGSTIMLWVDGLPIGHPSYNHYRDDIAMLFPGYANSNGAVGVYALDTTAFANGVHTIAWSVRDGGGNEDGIGSRYFSILNAGMSSPQSGLPVRGSLTTLAELQGYRDGSAQPMHARRGYDRSRPPDHILVTPGAHAPYSHGVIPAPPGNPGFSQGPLLVVPELERLEIMLDERAWAVDAQRRVAEMAGLPTAHAPMGRPASRWEGYLIVGEELRALPIGSTLDAVAGVFSWLPGPGFLGDYRLVFVNREGMSRAFLTVRIEPRAPSS